MTNWLSQNWLGVVTTILSAIALYVSIKAWQKSRAIYSIETTTIRQVRGRRDDEALETKMAEINAKLKTGKYTILHITTREADGDFQLFLGKIK